MNQDMDKIDPTRDRVWVVDAVKTTTLYVIAETEAEARTFVEQAISYEPDQGAASWYDIRELTDPVGGADGRTIALGRLGSESGQLSVDQSVRLVREHRPLPDDRTLPTPFMGPEPGFDRRERRSR
jgi:hypothetical protein